MVSKLHPIVTRGTRFKEDEFEFNKDAGMYVCKAGLMAIGKKFNSGKSGNKNSRIRFLFDVEKCKVCPFRPGCYKDGAKTKSYYITIKSNEHLEQEKLQNTERFKTLAKTRYKIEEENSELKHGYGLETAKSSGLFGMEIQGDTAIFAVNLKRILKLMKEKRENKEQ